MEKLQTLQEQLQSKALGMCLSVRVLLYTRVLFVFGAEGVVTYAELAVAVEGTQYVCLSAFLYARVQTYIWDQ